MATSLNQYAALLKTLYMDGKDLVRIAYEREPFFAMVPKMEKFGGDGKKIAVLSSNGNRVSGTFSTTSSLTGEASSVAFQVTRGRVFNIVDLDHETILAARVAGDAGAIRDHVKQSTDQAIDALSARIGTMLYRNLGGASGRLADGTDLGGTVRLTVIEDAINFDVGDVIVLASTDGTSGAIRSGTATVNGVDRDLGALRFATSLGGSISGAAQSDYVFKSGDFGAGIAGLSSWIPSTAPTSGDSFYGVDRSVDAQRLAGVRFDGYNGDSVENMIIDASAKLMRYGARPDHVFMNPTQWAIVAKNLQTQVRYGLAKSSDGKISFDTLELQCPSGMLKLVPDHRCPVDKIYLLELKTWTCGSAGQLPQIFDLDGALQRNASADNYELRLGGYFQLWCRAPGRNAVIHTLPSS